MTPRKKLNIHPSFDLKRFKLDEQQILETLATEWYLTNSGGQIQWGVSKYDWFLMKPNEEYSELFNLKREIIVVLSDYPKFEPRTLDAFDYAKRDRRYQEHVRLFRIESVCRVLISKDPDVETKVPELLKSDPEQPIVIPFNYSELAFTRDQDPYFLKIAQNHFSLEICLVSTHFANHFLVEAN